MFPESADHRVLNLPAFYSTPMKPQKYTLLTSTTFAFLSLFSAAVTSAHAEDELAARLVRGKATFMTCAACHGMDGKGLPTNPPMAPSLSGSKLAIGPAEVTTAIVLKGIAKTDAKYLGIMAPLGAGLTDEQIADVITYVRKSFGNQASEVAVADVKTWREKYKEVTASLPRTAYEKKAEKLEADAKATPAPAPSNGATPSVTPAPTEPGK